MSPGSAAKRINTAGSSLMGSVIPRAADERKRRRPAGEDHCVGRKPVLASAHPDDTATLRFNGIHSGFANDLGSGSFRACEKLQGQIDWLDGEVIQCPSRPMRAARQDAAPFR